MQTCYNLLKQFAASLCMKSFDSKLATNVLTTCNKSVDNLQQAYHQQADLQAMRTHPDIGLLITVCCKMSADLNLPISGMK